MAYMPVSIPHQVRGPLEDAFAFARANPLEPCEPPESAIPRPLTCVMTGDLEYFDALFDKPDNHPVTWNGLIPRSDVVLLPPRSRVSLAALLAASYAVADYYNGLVSPNLSDGRTAEQLQDQAQRAEARLLPTFNAAGSLGLHRRLGVMIKRLPHIVEESTFLRFEAQPALCTAGETSKLGLAALLMSGECSPEEYTALACIGYYGLRDLRRHITRHNRGAGIDDQIPMPDDATRSAYWKAFFSLNADRRKAMRLLHRRPSRRFIGQLTLIHEDWKSEMEQQAAPGQQDQAPESAVPVAAEPAPKPKPRPRAPKPSPSPQPLPASETA